MKIKKRLHKFAKQSYSRATLFAWRHFPKWTEFALVNWSSKTIPVIAAEIEQGGRFHAALNLVSRRKHNGHYPKAMDVVLPRYLSKLNKHQELRLWFDNHYSLVMTDPFAEKHRPFRTPLTRAADELQIDGPRQELIAAAKMLQASTGKRAKAANKALFDYRMFDELIDDRLFKKGSTVSWRYIEPAIEGRKHCSKIAPWVSLASRNEALTSEKRQSTGPTPQIEIFIPSHYFATWDDRLGGARQDNWQDIRDAFDSFAQGLIKSGYSVQPRHQYYLNFACPTQNVPSISFFTKGGSAKHWHMRDVGLGHYLSIDPDGYWGSSSISKLNIRPKLEAMRVHQRDVRASISFLTRWYSSKGGNKYASNSKEAAESIEPNAIFVPLQAPNGLEETNHSVEELIDILIRYSRETDAVVYLRRHPLDRSRYVTKLIEHAVRTSKCRVSKATPWRLAAETAATVTLNSATILSSIVAGKPVFTWGSTDAHSVTTDIGSYDDFRKNMDAARSGENGLREIQERFCHFYLKHYLVDLSDEVSVRRRIELLLDFGNLESKDAIRHAFINSLFLPLESKP